MAFKKLNSKKCVFILYLIFATSVIYMIISLIITGGFKKIIKEMVLDTTVSNYRAGALYSGYSKPFLPEYLIATALPSTMVATQNLEFLNFNDFLNYNYFIEEDDEKKPNNDKGIGTIKDVTIKPKSDNGYLKYGNTFLIDQSSKKPNLEEIMKSPLNLAFHPYDKGPQILIYHTHNSESFNEGDLFSYNIGDDIRSQDNTKNVIAIGDTIEKNLEEKNVSVTHTITKNEMQEFNKSYSKSELTAKSYLKKYPTINMSIDIHRDTIISESNEKYRTIAEIDGKRAAQIMIIVGTGSKELPNEHWQENLRTAIILQQKLESKYKDLCRPILIRDARYNMHLTHGSLLIEMGTDGNSLEEVEYSATLLSQALSELINERIT
ncbi:MAG: stage II sporulation protein P [Clostridia bacterium]